MQDKAADKYLPFHMQPRGWKEALSLVKGTGLLHRSLDISTLHQGGNGDSQHIKPSCIAFITRLYDKVQCGEVHRINSAVSRCEYQAV